MPASVPIMHNSLRHTPRCFSAFLPLSPLSSRFFNIFARFFCHLSRHHFRSSRHHPRLPLAPARHRQSCLVSALPLPRVGIGIRACHPRSSSHWLNRVQSRSPPCLAATAGLGAPLTLSLCSGFGPEYAFAPAAASSLLGASRVPTLCSGSHPGLARHLPIPIDFHPHLGSAPSASRSRHQLHWHILLLRLPRQSFGSQFIRKYVSAPHTAPLAIFASARHPLHTPFKY